MGNKKISCHLVPELVTDLPFEGTKVEGSQKHRREKVLKAGSKREETITEPFPRMQYRNNNIYLVPQFTIALHM